MPVTVGAGVGEYNSTIQHVSNGDPANQTVFRAPSINLENRTDALKTFTEAQETLRNAQLGSSDSAIGGVQGTFNTSHLHTGADGSGLLDFQQIYNNDSDQADLQLAAGGYFEIKKSDSTSLLKVDNDTGVVSIGVGLAVDSVNDTHIDWGTGASQVSADDIPDGTTNVMLTSAYKSSLDTHMSDGADTVHNLNLTGRPLQMNNISADGASDDVSTEMSGQTAGGSVSQEGIVTGNPANWVIIKEADTNDDLVDAQGNKVYGRITESSGTWTLTYYSNVAGTETAYTEFSSKNISWWVQKIYNLSNVPVYDPIFSVPKDQVAALHEPVLVQDYTVIGNVGDLNQQKAGHQLTLESFYGGTPTGLWVLDDTTDDSGNNNHISLNASAGGFTGTDPFGNPNSALNVIDSVGQIAVDPNLEPFTGSGSFTAGIWMLPDLGSLPTESIAMGKFYYPNGPTRNWFIGLLSGGLHFKVYTSPSNFYEIVDYTTSTGEWVHLVGVYDQSDTRITLYANGVEVGTVQNATLSTRLSSDAPLSFAGGIEAFDEFGGDISRDMPYYGLLSNSFYAGWAMTADEIKRLYSVRYAAPNFAGTDYDLRYLVKKDGDDNRIQKQNNISEVARNSNYIYLADGQFGSTDKLRIVGVE
jgi:hypothetical protein